MSYQDKVLLMHKVEETLKPRMFANLLEEAVGKIQEDLDEFDVTHVAFDADRKEDLLDLISRFLIRPKPLDSQGFQAITRQPTLN